MAVRSYRDLTVWQKSIGLVERIYGLTKAFPPEEKFGLSNQMRRCAVSISSNIAEGQGRSSSKEFRRFLHLSLGSLAELDTQMEICKRLGYIKEENFNKLDEAMLEIRKMIFGLIKSLQN